MAQGPTPFKTASSPQVRSAGATSQSTWSRDVGVAYDVVHLRRLPQGPLFSQLALTIRVAPFCSAMAMAMEMTSASAQALLAVSAHRRLVSLRHCTVALPPLRSHAPALPRRLVVVRATSQVDTGSTASPKATVPDTEVSITKVWLCALE